MSHSTPTRRIWRSARRNSGARFLVIPGLLALMLLAPSAVPVGAVTATGIPTVDSETGRDEEPRFTLQLAPVSPVWSDTDRAYDLTVSVANHTEEPLPSSVLTLSISTSPVASAAALTEIPQAADTRFVSRSTLPTVAPGETREIAVSVPRGQLPFTTETTPGAYTVTSTLTLPQTEPLDTHADPITVGQPVPVVWQGLPEDHTIGVSFVVPFVLPAAISAMPTEAQLEAEIPRLRALLTAAQTAQATLAIDPRILVAIRAAGAAASATATDLLDAFVAAPQPKFLLQFNDADPAAEAALGATELLTPPGFSFVTRSGVFPVTAAGEQSREDSAAADRKLDPSPERSAAAGGEAEADAHESPGEGTGDREIGAESDTETDSQADSESDGESDGEFNQHVPTYAELSALPGATDTAWPAAGQVNEDTLRLLNNSGIHSIVLDSSNATSSSSSARIAGFSALIANSTLSAQSTVALSTENRTEQDAAEARLVAHLAVLGSAAAAPTVITLDRDASATDSHTTALLNTLTDISWIRPTLATDLQQGTGTLVPGTPSADRVAGLTELTNQSDLIESLAPLLTEPEFLIEYQQLRLLGAFATRYASPRVQFTDVVERIQERNDELLQGVQVVSTENTQLIGTSSRIPVTLHNHLPFEATVSLQVAAGSAAIEVDQREYPAIAVPANGNTVTLVGLSSRVSSGDSELLITVHDAGNTQQFSHLNMQLTLRTAYEAVMLTVLGASALALLIAGIWRSIRRKNAPVPHEFTPPGNTSS